MGCAGYVGPGGVYRVLSSYWYQSTRNGGKTLPETFAPFDLREADVIVDSGVFTSRQLGASIKVEDYAVWLRRNAEWLNAYITVDAPNVYAAIAANTERLDRLGPPGKVVAVVQPFMTRDQVRATLERWEYVAVGTAGITAHNKLHWTAAQHEERRRFFGLVHEEAARLGGRRLHGLAATSTELLRDFPWYSVDSRSWGAGASFGSSHVFDPDSGTMRIVNQRDRRSVLAVADLLRRHYDEDCSLLLTADHTGVGYLRRILRLGARSFQLLEAWATRRWRKLVPGYELRLYCVDSAGSSSRSLSGMHDISQKSRRDRLVKRINRAEV